MARRWAWVLAIGLGWVTALSCSLDLGPVLKAKDGGADAARDASDAASDAKDGGVYVLPEGCLNTAIVMALCDPFSNAGCSGGYGCDTTFYTQPRLACLQNDGVKLGGNCDLDKGPYCAPMLTCSGAPGVCSKFCCTNTQCGGGSCVPFDPNLGTLGFCSNATDGGGGSDGSGV